jgi:hypothetical protein
LYILKDPSHSFEINKLVSGYQSYVKDVNIWGIENGLMGYVAMGVIEVYTAVKVALIVNTRRPVLFKFGFAMLTIKWNIAVDELFKTAFFRAGQGRGQSMDRS